MNTQPTPANEITITGTITGEISQTTSATGRPLANFKLAVIIDGKPQYFHADAHDQAAQNLRQMRDTDTATFKLSPYVNDYTNQVQLKIHEFENVN